MMTNQELKSGDKVYITEYHTWSESFISYYTSLSEQCLDVISVEDHIYFTLVKLSTPGYGIGFVSALLNEVELYKERVIQ